MDCLINNIDKSADYIYELFNIISKYSYEEIILTDDKFNIIFHNSKYIKEDKKCTLFDVTDNFMNDEIRINIEHFKTSTKKHIFLKLIFNEDGALKNLPVDVHITKIISKKNKIKGYCIMIQDITQEIKNKIQRETFIDIISHDLKTPMIANIQILELILNNKFGKINDNLKDVLDELLGSCRFMQYMAENLLIKYKNEFSLYELNKEQYPIVKLIKDSCNNLMNMLNRKKQTVELVINGKNRDVNIDVEEMEKVVKNLIVNSSEQSKENSKIIIQITSNQKIINVSFISSGYSHKPEILSEIFDEYMSCSNKFRKIGFGLELYNCKKIIEAHNGHIYAKNESEESSSICFSLPCVN